MRNLEDELRDLYRAVTDTVREEDLPGLYEQRARPPGRRFRLGRFSAFAPLAAAAAVVAAIGAGFAIPRLVSSPAAAPTTAASAAVGSSAPPPPFMVIINTPNAQRPLVVVSAATGRTTATVPVPRKGTAWFDVVPTVNDTTFIAAATSLRGGLCNPTYLYTLTLSASGKAVSVRPWTTPVVPAEIDSLSASADGRTLAFAETACRGPDQEIGIIRDGKTKTWQEPYPLFADHLTLSADGSKLGYTEIDIARLGARVRVLDAGTAPGSATAASKIVYTYPAAGRASDAVISADFTTLYVSWLTAKDSFHLAGYQIGPGGVQRTLFRRTTPDGLEISLAGGQVLVWNPGVSLYLVDPVTGKATRVRTAWVNAWGIVW